MPLMAPPVSIRLSEAELFFIPNSGGIYVDAYLLLLRRKGADPKKLRFALPVLVLGCKDAIEFETTGGKPIYIGLNG